MNFTPFIKVYTKRHFSNNIYFKLPTNVKDQIFVTDVDLDPLKLVKFERPVVKRVYMLPLFFICVKNFNTIASITWLPQIVTDCISMLVVYK